MLLVKLPSIPYSSWITQWNTLKAYSDVDWAGDLVTSRSTNGYIVHLWGEPETTANSGYIDYGG